MEVSKVQHELSPEMETKIISLFKKLIKVYVVVLGGILGLGIAGFMLFYFLAFKPMFDNYNSIRSEGLKLIEDSRRQFEEYKKTSKEKFNSEVKTGDQKFQEELNQGQQKFNQDLQKAKDAFQQDQLPQ